MWNKSFYLPLIAVLMLVFAVGNALVIQRREPETPPPVPPPATPYGDTVAGIGMVEASTNASGTGNIAVGSQLAGVVIKVDVVVGQSVKANDLLVELDTRQAAAELKLREAVLQATQQQLRKLTLQPRPEEIPASEAQVEVAEANLRQTTDQYERSQKLLTMGGIAQQEFIASQQAHNSARSQLALARANLALIKAGAWEPDRAIAAANVEQARAQVEQAKTMLQMLQIRAPVDGSILQINVRPGEYVSTLGGQSLIVMGNLQPLHVRVNVDEEDLPRLTPNAPARARIRGGGTKSDIPLAFVRLEPFVVPKTSLAGVNTERVDTRVVQIIYSADLDNALVRDGKLLVGQLVDVFVDARTARKATKSFSPEP